MDIQAIGRVVAPLAPMVGSILGGLIPFPGGSIIGQKVGERIALAFGVDPKAANAASQISDRIAEAGEETARAKINAVVEQARIQIDGFVAYERAVLEAQVKNLADVNVTMRAEAEARLKLKLAGMQEHWFFSGWRPAFAWVFISVWGFFGLMLTFVTGKAVWLSPEPFDLLKDAWPLFAAYFAPGAAVVGVLIPSRSYEKGKAIENATPMPNAKSETTAVPAVVKSTPAVVKPPAGKVIPPPLGDRP